MSYANGDFSPFHKYGVTFDTVTLPDGRQLPVATSVSAGTEQVVHLSTSAEKQKSASQRATDAGKGKIHEAKDQIHQSWEQVTAPGKMDRLKRYIVAQSPYRHQYIEPGTRFNADLDSAISFGEIQRTSDDFTALASALPPNTTLKARLLGEVNSATATRGTRCRGRFDRTAIFVCTPVNFAGKQSDPRPGCASQGRTQVSSQR